MILCYNIIYVCKISEDKLGGCWWSFSWLGQKVKYNMHSCMPIKTTSLRQSVDKMAKSIDFRWLCVLNCFFWKTADI